jgi:hypothetical protein
MAVGELGMQTFDVVVVVVVVLLLLMLSFDVCLSPQVYIVYYFWTSGLIGSNHN